MLQNMTLILMDPDSGFILTEQQEDRRDAATWMKVSQAATSGLNVKIVQVTGDEASGIIKFTTELLGAQKVMVVRCYRPTSEAAQPSEVVGQKIAGKSSGLNATTEVTNVTIMKIAQNG